MMKAVRETKNANDQAFLDQTKVCQVNAPCKRQPTTAHQLSR
jgi:hypothetical protein